MPKNLVCYFTEDNAAGYIHVHVPHIYIPIENTFHSADEIQQSVELIE